MVERFHADGQVTFAGRLRLMAQLRVAEVILGPDRQRAAFLALERFLELATDQALVPGEPARHALVDAAEQLIAQYRLTE